MAAEATGSGTAGTGEGDDMRVDVVYTLSEDEVADLKDRNGLDAP